jgi:hypothetical protein
VGPEQLTHDRAGIVMRAAWSDVVAVRKDDANLVVEVVLAGGTVDLWEVAGKGVGASSRVTWTRSMTDWTSGRAMALT